MRRGGKGGTGTLASPGLMSTSFLDLPLRWFSLSLIPSCSASHLYLFSLFVSFSSLPCPLPLLCHSRSRFSLFHFRPLFAKSPQSCLHVCTVLLQSWRERGPAQTARFPKTWAATYVCGFACGKISSSSLLLTLFGRSQKVSGLTRCLTA